MPYNSQTALKKNKVGRHVPFDFKTYYKGIYNRAVQMGTQIIQGQNIW